MGQKFLPMIFISLQLGNAATEKVGTCLISSPKAQEVLKFLLALDSVRN
jgi:hypothetical protein